MAITDGADIGYGTAITFQSGLLAEIIELIGENLNGRKVIQIIHMALASGNMRKIPSDVYDAGRWKVKLYFETQRLAAYRTAATSAAETVTVTFPIPSGGAAAGTIAASGFASDMGTAVPVEDGMTADITVELTGAPTWTSAT